MRVFVVFLVFFLIKISLPHAQSGAEIGNVIITKRLNEFLVSSATYKFEYVTLYIDISRKDGTDKIPVIHIRYDDNVFFDYDKYELNNSAEKAVEGLADIISDSQNNVSIVVVGHTDSVGTEEYNQDLSKKRALSVIDKLTKLGLDDRALIAVPMGELQPIQSNGTPIGRARNRRVEFFISSSSEASLQAAQSADFNPCYRNDHLVDEGSGNKTKSSTEKCVEKKVKVAAYARDGLEVVKVRELLIASDSDVTTMERPMLPSKVLVRPLLGVR
jgi:hypothetical protein